MSDDSPRPFRWQALLGRAAEAVFILDRRRRLLFVNSAWEQLTGLAADRVHGMLCRRPRPAPADAAPEDLLAHVFTPPPEVLQGSFARARRLFLDRGRPRWWDVEFLPLRQNGEREGYFILGRVVPLPPGEPSEALVVPERLMDLRQRWANSFALDLLDSPRPIMRKLAEQVRIAATVRAPVLLVGERGAGKETVARIIHYQGPQKERSFAALDCRQLPSSLIAGILFGDRPPGLGAIYLDDPASLTRDLQLRLVEWLANASAAAPGEDGSLPPLRLFAGCARPAEDEVQAGRLLEELHSRISPLTLTVPPLRERLDDLPRLIERILANLPPDGDRTIAGVTPAAQEVLLHHSWPGNLDELHQVLSDARIRATGERIGAGDLPAALRLAHRLDQEAPRPAAPTPLQERLEQVERRLIQLALHRAGGNRTLAAELLGLWRSKLLRRMEALKLVEEGEEKEEG